MNSLTEHQHTKHLTDHDHRHICYRQTVKGRFISRRNRFIAEVEISGKNCIVHVKNTGRCRELLLPGAEVYLEKSDNPARKTLYDLIAVKKIRRDREPLLINMDSQIPNDAVFKWLPGSGMFSGNAIFKREVVHRDSRFDIFVKDGSRQMFIEVKGVTLENNGTAMFPDAPTARGVKHLKGLAACVQEGFEACVIFVIQMKDIRCFKPCDSIDPAFGDALRHAAGCGVNILAMDCLVTADSVTIDAPVKIELS